MALQNLKIVEQLASHPHVRARKVKIESQDGTLVIDGQVDTFFAKQIAQESLRKMEGIGVIDNRLKVEWAQARS